MIEAMAAGKPIISTRVGGIEDLLESTVIKGDGGFSVASRGILISSGDADALAMAMIHLREKKDSNALMVARARGFAMRNFSKERLINNIYSLYRELQA